MAWPKPRNRRSVPMETLNDGGGAPNGARPHAVAPGQSARPSWPDAEHWPSAHATVAPSPDQAELSPVEDAEEELSLADDGEAQETDPGDRPFWESWGQVDDPAELDDAGDGFTDGGPADDAVTDVDPPPPRPAAPRPRRSGEPVVAAAGETREQPKAEGIGEHLGSLAHLRANPRMR